MAKAKTAHAYELELKKILPNDAIIIDGEIYALRPLDPDEDDCETCDLHEICHGQSALDCVCVVAFGYEKSIKKNFKKLKR